MWSLLLIYVFLLICAVQLTYYLLIFGGAQWPSAKNNEQQKEPVSVLVCAKNEAENLKKNIPLILEQIYPDFELLLINDASSDETLEVMRGFAKANNHVKIVDVQHNETFWGKKKYALTLGIKTAKNNLLLFTDADCKPASKYWIQAMTNSFTEQKVVVLGYGAYEKTKPFLLNKLIRFETLQTAIQYISYTAWGMPYMGVGRNLAYTKELFFQHNGFVGHMDIRSGDDDLFVNQAAQSSNTALCLEVNGYTVSQPKDSFSAWIRQKRRHLTTAHRYRAKHKFLLGLFYLSQILYWVVLPPALWVQKSSEPFLLMVPGSALLVLISKYAISYRYTKKLGEKDLWWAYPFWEILLLLIQFYIFMRNLISKPKFWN